MKEAFRLIRGDRCPKCNNPRGIELYDSYNRGLNYTQMCDKKSSIDMITKSINNRTADIVFGRCRFCGEKFKIHWVDGFPYPIGDEDQISNMLTFVFPNKFGK